MLRKPASSLCIWLTKLEVFHRLVIKMVLIVCIKTMWGLFSLKGKKYGKTLTWKTNSKRITSMIALINLMPFWNDMLIKNNLFLFRFLNWWNGCEELTKITIFHYYNWCKQRKCWKRTRTSFTFNDSRFLDTNIHPLSLLKLDPWCGRRIYNVSICYWFQFIYRSS